VTERSIRVLVVEDNFYTRLGTVTVLRGRPEVEVVGEAVDGEGALALFGQLRPDVVFLDLRLPGIDGVRVAAALRAQSPDARVLVLTHYQGEEDIIQALRAGALGYLTKKASGDDLLAAIRAVHGGRRFVPPELLRSAAGREVRDELTRRERQVLELVAQGAPNREIAGALGISHRTVELYVSSILAKFGAGSRTEAVAMALRSGLIHGPDPGRT
jgi:DNA-binding NarL/FixJ family response regulator